MAELTNTYPGANVLLGDRVYHGTLIKTSAAWVLVTTRNIAQTPVYNFAERIHLRMFKADEVGATLVALNEDCGPFSQEGWTFAEAEMQGE